MFTRMMTIALALAAQFGVAMAGPDAVGDRTETMLRDLLRKDQPVAKRAAVERTAKIKLIGRINKVGSFSRPVRCYFDIYYYDGFDSFSEQKDQEAEFDGDLGRCEITIPFRWDVADDSQLIEAYAYISNSSAGRQVTKAPGTPVYRSSSLNLPRLPLPAEGATEVVRFNIDF